MQCALVTAIGSFSADIAIKNLKKMNFRVIGCDIYPKEWIVDAYNVHAFYQAPLATKENEYIDFIKNLCQKESINFILPSTDVELDAFRQHRIEFNQMNITVCISSEKTLAICRNKSTTEKFIRENRLPVKTIPTKKIINGIIPYDTFPIVCKPLNGRSSQGLKYIHSKEEWDFFIQSITNFNDYIVQPYISGNIITVDVVRDIYNNCVSIPRKELLRTPNGAGTSVYIFHDEVLEDCCNELARKLDIIGCVNFEFIQDEFNLYHFIECNARFAGGVEFSCIAGYDCIRNHIKAFQGEKIDNFKLSRNQYIARKYEEYVTAIY